MFRWASHVLRIFPLCLGYYIYQDLAMLHAWWNRDCYYSVQYVCFEGIFSYGVCLGSMVSCWPHYGAVWQHPRPCVFLRNMALWWREDVAWLPHYSGGEEGEALSAMGRKWWCWWRGCGRVYQRETCVLSLLSMFVGGSAVMGRSPKALLLSLGGMMT